MNEELVDGWNRLVDPSDLVYYLGDFSLKSSAVEQYAPRLNGHKILVAGNHDGCHPSNHNGVWKNVAFYRKYFDEIVDEMEWEGFRLHHMPYYDDEDDRFPDYRPFNDGKVLLHGHVHQRWVINGRQINVGVDVWDYLPVAAEELVAMASRLDG